MNEDEDEEFGGEWSLDHLRCGMTCGIGFLSSPNTLPNGFKVAISCPFMGNTIYKTPTVMDMLGPYPWAANNPPTRSCNGSGEAQEALLCDNANFLRQCWYASQLIWVLHWLTIGSI